MTLYGIDTANPFALLQDDEQDEDAERLAQTTAVDEKLKNTSTGTTPTGRGGRGRQTRRSEGQSREQQVSHEGDYSREGGKGNYGGRTGGTGRGTGRGRGNRGKRQYDRRDGTGRGHEIEKRHGGGKANWGVSGETDVTPTQTTTGWETTEETTQEQPPPETSDNQKKEGEEPVEAETEEKEEAKPEDKPVYTLAEYEEMLKEKGELAVPVAKKEAHVVDTSQFDGMAVLKKSQEESGFEGLEVEKVRKKKERREKEVETVEVGFRVGDRPGRGRGRGRGRGGRSRDFDRDDDAAPARTNSSGWTPDVPRTDPSGPRYYITQDLEPMSSTDLDRPRGRGRFRGRGSYGQHASRGAGQRGVDIASENTFPSLSG